MNEVYRLFAADAVRRAPLAYHPSRHDRPLSMKSAWRAYDRLFEDDGVTLLPEPAGMETAFSSANIHGERIAEALDGCVPDRIREYT